MDHTFPDSPRPPALTRLVAALVAVFAGVTAVLLFGLNPRLCVFALVALLVYRWEMAEQ